MEPSGRTKPKPSRGRCTRHNGDSQALSPRGMKSDRHLITFGPATVPAGDVLVHDPQGDELLARDGLQAAPDDPADDVRHIGLRMIFGGLRLDG